MIVNIITRTYGKSIQNRSRFLGGNNLFESFDLTKFGSYLRDLRKSLGLTQKQVQKLSGVTADAIRRIEHGQVVPQYETLVYLSHVYKKDLITDMKTYSSINKLYHYYWDLEELIIHYDLKSLEELEESFADYIKNSPEKNSLINKAVAEQFSLTLSGIKKYYSNERASSYEDFYAALKISHPDFEIDNFDKFRYTEFELRILLLVGVSLTTDLGLGNFILLFCLENTDSGFHSNMHSKMLRIKAYFNLAYNYHRLYDSKRCLKFASEGIKYCNKNYLSYGLGPLLYRKGIAELELGYTDYLNTLQQSLYILSAQGDDELAEYYKQVTYVNYEVSL